MSKGVFVCCNEANIHNVYGGAYQRLTAQSEIYPQIITSAAMLEDHLPHLADTEVIFSTWGMLQLPEDILRKLPRLKALFYAAGSVRGFAEPFFNCGVKIISAWQANGLPVAEFTLSHILLACRGYFANIRSYRQHKKNCGIHKVCGSYKEKVGIIGAGVIGQRVIRLLKPFDLEILLYDPYLSPADAVALGVKQAELDTLFRQCIVVSNHLPLTDETRGMIKGSHFTAMRDGATFINTGRGATVDEAAMLAVLEQRPSIQGILDVTVSEPPGEDSPLFRLPNVILSPHIAGSGGNELNRMADYCLADYGRFKRGEPLEYEVTSAMLENMA